MNSSDFQAFKQLDQLADRSRKHLFSFSPNDALVQISLPLVLILAIAARLMILSQSIAAQDKGPAILDLWKQQLILRIDKVLEEWERESEYAAFPEFSRIQWKSNWPEDKRFQRLCREAIALNDADTLALDLYHSALSYRPTETEAEPEAGFSYLLDIYDPQAPNPPANADKIPPDFRITPERREFAINYIGKRCMAWKARIEDFQWALVACCAEQQPITEEWSDRQLAAQMQKLARTLEERGYPLLADVAREYQAEREGGR